MVRKITVFQVEELVLFFENDPSLFFFVFKPKFFLNGEQPNYFT